MTLRIKEILKEKELTQIDLAKELGVSKIRVNKLINGNPTVDTLQRIATILEVDVKDLFTSTGDKETLYIEREGKYIPVGEIDLKDI